MTYTKKWTIKKCIGIFIGQNDFPGGVFHFDKISHSLHFLTHWLCIVCYLPGKGSSVTQEIALLFCFLQHWLYIRVFHSLYKVGRNRNFVFKGFNNSKKKLPPVGLNLMLLLVLNTKLPFLATLYKLWKTRLFVIFQTRDLDFSALLISTKEHYISAMDEDSTPGLYSSNENNQTASDDSFKISRTINFNRMDYQQLQISRLLVIKSFPVIIVIGTIGNVLTFIVMQRGSLKHSSTCFYMAMLASADTCKYMTSEVDKWCSSYASW